MEISLLKEAGLTEGEAKVYLSLLELGTTTSGPITEKSKVSRSIIYNILEKLIEKGLVSFVIKEKTKYFQACNPNKLLIFIEEKEDVLKENKEKIEKILPELMLKHSLAKNNEAQIYLGIKGIRAAYENLYLKLKNGDEFCFLGLLAELSEDQEAYWKKDHIRREKAGIKCRLLFNNGTSDLIIKERNKHKDCQAKIMYSSIKTPAMFMMYRDTTLILLQYPKAIAVEIINQEIKDSFQEYFEEYWKRSNKE